MLMFGFCVLCFFRGVGFVVHCIASFGGLVSFSEWTFTVLLPRNGVCILLLWLKLLARRRSLFCLSLRLGGSVVSVDRYIQSIAISMNLISRYPYPLQTISGDIRRRYLIPTNLFPTQNKPHMHRNSAAPSQQLINTPQNFNEIVILLLTRCTLIKYLISPNLAQPNHTAKKITSSQPQ